METENNSFQIRKLKEKDLDEVMSIWLSSNLDTHTFISADYWKNNFDMVKEAIAGAEVYICEGKGERKGNILSFIGIVPDDYIAGFFVQKQFRSQGVGKSLLNYAKSKHSTLALKVFTKNTRAIQFYQREGFIIQEESLDTFTNEKEYFMVWKTK